MKDVALRVTPVVRDMVNVRTMMTAKLDLGVVITTVSENRLTLTTIVVLNLLKVQYMLQLIVICLIVHCHLCYLQGHGENGDNSRIVLIAQLGTMLFVIEHVCL